ncbi:hypothetical protein RABR111495_25180 [Rahnella bruchi]
MACRIGHIDTELMIAILQRRCWRKAPVAVFIDHDFANHLTIIINSDGVARIAATGQGRGVVVSRVAIMQWASKAALIIINCAN